ASGLRPRNDRTASPPKQNGRPVPGRKRRFRGTTLLPAPDRSWKVGESKSWIQLFNVPTLQLRRLGRRLIPSNGGAGPPTDASAVSSGVNFSRHPQEAPQPATSPLCEERTGYSLRR